MPSAIPDIKKKKNKRKKPLTIKKITFSVYEDILRQFRYIQDKSVNSSENCVFCTVEQWKKYKGEFFIEKYFLVKVDNESQEIKRKKKKKVVLFYLGQTRIRLEKLERSRECLCIQSSCVMCLEFMKYA